MVKHNNKGNRIYSRSYFKANNNNIKAIRKMGQVEMTAEINRLPDSPAGGIPESRPFAAVDDLTL